MNLTGSVIVGLTTVVQSVPFIVSPSPQLYRIESLHLPGHPVTATVLRDITRVIPAPEKSHSGLRSSSSSVPENGEISMTGS